MFKSRVLSTGASSLAPALVLAFALSTGPSSAQVPVVTNDTAVKAATPDATTTNTTTREIDPAKKAAIKELLQLTKMGESVTSMRDTMMNQVRSMIDVFVKRQIAADAHISDDRKKEMLATLSESSDRIINRYRELMQERIDLPQIMEQVAYKVYDESFSTSEIQDISNFYRTPTGQKALREMPQIMQRSMSMASQAMQSKMVDIIKEVTSEEFARLKSQRQGDAGACPAGNPAAKIKDDKVDKKSDQ